MGVEVCDKGAEERVRVGACVFRYLDLGQLFVQQSSNPYSADLEPNLRMPQKVGIWLRSSAVVGRTWIAKLT